ncbi:MAG: NAD(P)/FAD-dependent oxidoreductase [Bacteroidota bacterium]
MAEVIICGAGVAGLTLARQLKLNFPNIDLTIVAKERFPVSDMKVGESTVEISGFYFKETLDLRDYMKNNQFTKMGLRYFYNGGEKKFKDRPELGLSRFPPYDSYQIDRSVLENDLYRSAIMAGVKIYEDSSVFDIELSESGQHKVTFTGSDKQTQTLSCDWVIDATGRRSIIQKKYELRTKLEKNCSSTWFRVKGRVEVDDLVDSEEKRWHNRVKDRNRYFSTIHLMGHGYWVWLIPLASGHTSIGVVTHDSIHNCFDHASPEKVMSWIRKHEPELADRIAGVPFVDFKALKSYAYSTKQLFSQNRWACVGDAALFPDPFYSPGMNIIGFENTMITRMIQLDREEKLTADVVKRFNSFVISYNEWLLDTIHSAYSHFGDDQIMSLNYIWDIAVGWSIICPQMFNHIIVDDEKYEAIREYWVRFSVISAQMRQLFNDWEEVRKDRYTFEFIDYLSIPFLKEIYARNLYSGKPVDELVGDYKKNLVILEELAQTIYVMALEDAMPDKLALMDRTRKFNPQIFNLKLEPWNDLKNLYEDKPLKHGIYEQVRSLYTSGDDAPAREQAVESAFDFNFNTSNGWKK